MDFETMGLVPYGPCPNARHMEWYRRGKTAFLHFTVNTFTDREWGDGTESPAVFAPTQLDCRQWARVLKEGGFTAAILTAKHHDGFCLWPSACTEHSVKNSPLAGRDIVREFTDACRELDIKPGIYLSPWDRHEKTWGQEEYNDFYASQLTELMTNYGPIWECWWDGAGSAQARYDWARWAGIVRQLQPQCVLWGCLGSAPFVDVRWVGNESGRAGEDCWATIDEKAILAENMDVLNTGDPDGSRFIPAETNLSIRPGWFWHEAQNDQVMDEEALVDYWFRSAGRNTAILLNLPPDRRGLIHETDAANVKAWNDRMEAIFSEDLLASAEADVPGAEKLLREEGIFPADNLTPAVTFGLKREVTFDCLRLEEVVELGHRVRGYRVEARAGGRWQTLLEGSCVGFCRAHRFAPVTADALRLTVTRAAEKPVLRRFSLHRGAAPRETARQEARLLNPTAVRNLGCVLEIELGGIYPFNQVTLTGAEGITWEVWAFNGADYGFAGRAEGNTARFATQTGSYRLEVRAEAQLPENAAVQVECC